MHFDPVVKSGRDRASPANVSNSNDKSVCRPTALPIPTKRTTTSKKTNLFGAATPRPASAPQRALKLHTDPFDGSRQAKAPRHLVKYIDVHYTAPRQTGLKHLPPTEGANKGFVSAGGAISFGGRRHQMQPSTAAVVSPEPSPEPMSIRESPTSAKPSVQRRSPISHEHDFAAEPAQPKLHSASRQRSYAPSLVGVMNVEAGKPARQFTLNAPFHRTTPPASPKNTVPKLAEKPWDKDQSKSCSSSLQRASKAPFHTNTPREAARTNKSAVRPPWHTDTPRR